MSKSIMENPAHLTLVLVKPQLGENIGAAARVMMNFALHDLRLVNPRDKWPNPDAAAMASGAGRVLDNAAILPTLTDSLDGIHYVYAMTARRRDIRKPILNPREAMIEARQRVSDGQGIAVVLGPERSGLENKDLAVANAIIEIPVNEEFKSLNLAQSVAIICYEWMCSGDGEGVKPVAPMVPADVNDKAKFVDLLVENLRTRDYFWSPENASGMELNLRNLLMRMDLSEAELRTLHGVRRALTRTPQQSASASQEMKGMDNG